MLAGTLLAFLAPLPVLLALALAGLVAMRARGAFVVFASITLAINVAILWAVDPSSGWLRGLTGGLRLVAALAVNLAVVSRAGAPRLLEGLRLPARATALLAAILLAAEDVGRDFARLRDARRLEGVWPAAGRVGSPVAWMKARVAMAREGARLVPLLLVAAHRRATLRREALQLAGHPFPAWFVPVVAIAALSAAGRLAFLALPNVALTFVVAFLAGMLYGGRVGAAGAFLGMALTDLLLTGLYPGGFVNAPAMALLAFLGAALRRARFDAALAGAVGIASTFLFSVVTDSLTWLLLYAGEPRAWPPIVLAGLVFNVVPALVNGALFAASVTPSVRAFRAWRAPAPRPPTPRAMESPAEPHAPPG